MSRNEKLQALANKIPEKLTTGEMENCHSRLRERDNTMVTGVFRNLDKPGESIKNVPYRKHKGDPINLYTLHDGCVATIPYGFAYFLEHECNKIVYKKGNAPVDSKLGNYSGVASGVASRGMQGKGSAVESYLPRFSFLSTDVPQRNNFMR